MRVPLPALALFLLAPSSVGQELRPQLQTALTGFRGDHGAAWRAHADRVGGELELLYGGRARSASRPADAGEWFALARSWFAATRELHRVDPAQLVDGRAVFLPLGMGNGSDKVAVSLDQVLDGVPVEHGGAHLLFSPDGALLALQVGAAPDVVPAGAPLLASLDAQAAAGRAFERLERLAPERLGNPRLVYARTQEGARSPARLAWQVDVAREVQGEEPVGWRFTIDAASGAVWRRETTVHHVDVTGSVRSMATSGTLPDIAANPPRLHDAAYVRVTSAAGTVFADANGDFTIPGTNGPIDVTIGFVGRFGDVRNQQGAEHVVTFPGLVTGQPNVLVLNPSPTGQITGQANPYLQVGVLRDWVRATVPQDSTADFVAVSNANLAQSCNAFYNGSSINFFRSSAGCVNTGYSTVVAHEHGHWLNVRYGTGNGSDGMGEGNADMWAMYLYDTPIVGEHFFNSGGIIRTGLNNRPYCGNGNPGCYGEVHADGEVWMGAGWKVRANLQSSLGPALGTATADLLFVSWMNAFEQRFIDSILELQWLLLDDDDGDINNGTPNHAAIDAGFVAQGFPGFVVSGLAYDVIPLADTTDEVGPYVLDARVTSSFGATVTGVDLVWRVDGGAFQTTPMGALGGGDFRGTIPGQPSPATVEYHVAAVDDAGRASVFPAFAPAELLTFHVGRAVSFLTSDFEGAGNGGWTVGSVDDDATAGIWEKGDPVGTLAQPEDDHTPGGAFCWFTAQGAPGADPNDADVDGGRTTLVSPGFDLVGVADPRVRYWRWYSNGEGAAPHQDILRVDVSRDGTSWATVEVVGPFGAQTEPGWRMFEFAIPPPHSATMRLRFRAFDLGADSLVEAALDDIEGIGFVSTCVSPARYCVSAPNSVGTGAIMHAFGSQSVTANELVLLASGAPVGQFGLFYYGTGQAQVPVGGGFVCIGTPFHRLPAVPIDGLGTATYALDLSAPPVPAARIDPGTSWNFAFWYRDPAGGAGFNFSDALAIEFCQ